jgi:hypothetical protein
MSIESTPSQYLLLFRNSGEWHRGLSPQELQEVTDQWMNWFNRLSEQGKVTAGHPLVPEGKIVSGKNGQFVADGPFVESKETIGGYFLLNVESTEEAIAIAQECPGLAYGARVEVRPVAAKCSLREKAEAELAESHA